MDHETITGLNKVREILANKKYSVVIIKNGEIIEKKKGKGLSPLLGIVEEKSREIKNSVVGDMTLGKASAMLCSYAGVKAVYSPKATKKAIALLITQNIPVQVDKIVPYIKNSEGNDICPFEKILENIDSPSEAYEVIKKKIKV
ncbi:MAG: DUF1893 domain-containing protein [Candidatus Thermoplasmatota archaeon]